MLSVPIWLFLHVVVHRLGSTHSGHSSSSSSLVLKVSGSGISSRHSLHHVTGLCPWSLASHRVVVSNVSSSDSSRGSRGNSPRGRTALLLCATDVASRGIWCVHVGCALTISKGQERTMFSHHKDHRVMCSTSMGSSHNRLVGIQHRAINSSSLLLHLS